MKPNPALAASNRRHRATGNFPGAAGEYERRPDTSDTMSVPTTRTALKRTTTFRIAAFALAGALSALTLAIAMPGGASYVAGRMLPDAGNAYETIATRSTGPTEVSILPARIDVVGARTEISATTAAPQTRG